MNSRAEHQKHRKELLEKHCIKALICARCGLQAPSTHLHHIDELYNGGDNETSNLIPLCAACHSEWDYYLAVGVDFKTFLNTPSLFAIAQGVKSNINQEYITTLLELHKIERVGNALKTGSGDTDIIYYDEIERQNSIFNQFPYSKTNEML